MIAAGAAARVKSSIALRVKSALLTAKMPLIRISDPATVVASSVIGSREEWVNVVPAPIVIFPAAIVPALTDVVPVEPAGLAVVFALNSALVPPVTEKLAFAALWVITPPKVAVVPALRVK